MCGQKQLEENIRRQNEALEKKRKKEQEEIERKKRRQERIRDEIRFWIPILISVISLVISILK